MYRKYAKSIAGFYTLFYKTGDVAKLNRQLHMIQVNIKKRKGLGFSSRKIV
jgi:hypothetical protein